MQYAANSFAKFPGTQEQWDDCSRRRIAYTFYVKREPISLMANLLFPVKKQEQAIEQYAREIGILPS